MERIGEEGREKRDGRGGEGRRKWRGGGIRLPIPNSWSRHWWTAQMTASSLRWCLLTSIDNNRRKSTSHRVIKCYWWVTEFGWVIWATSQSVWPIDPSIASSLCWFIHLSHDCSENGINRSVSRFICPETVYSYRASRKDRLPPQKGAAKHTKEC